MEDLYRLNSDRQIKQFGNQLMESNGLGGQYQRRHKTQRKGKYNWWLLRKNEDESKGIEQEKEAKCLKRNTLK